MIDEDYTFGDLLSLLRNVHGIGDLSPMLGYDVVAFLADADRPREADDEQPIQYLQVCNVVELTNYEANPSLPDEPLGWMDDDEAIDFTPLSALLHLPLRYDPTVRFWSGSPRGAGELSFETQVTITFGEFLRAVFWEVGFHGSPSERDNVRQSLRERVAAIERDDSDES